MIIGRYRVVGAIPCDCPERRAQGLAPLRGGGFGRQQSAGTLLHIKMLVNAERAKHSENALPLLSHEGV